MAAAGSRSPFWALCRFFFLLLALKVLSCGKNGLTGHRVCLRPIFARAAQWAHQYLHGGGNAGAGCLIYAVAVLIVLRFGLVPLACAIFTVNVMGNLPVSSDFSAWYMTTSILVLLSVVALAGWGFYHSLGGEPLWVVEPE